MGKIVFRETRTKSNGVKIRSTRSFAAGPPEGAADLSGIDARNGRRVELEVKIDAPYTKTQKRWAADIQIWNGAHALLRYNKKISVEENVKLATEIVSAELERCRGWK